MGISLNLESLIYVFFELSLSVRSANHSDPIIKLGEGEIEGKERNFIEC